MGPQMKLGGVSGGGTLNLNVTATATQNSRLNGGWSGFTGTLNLSATGAQKLICANFNGDSTNGTFNNLNAATVNLDNVNLGGRDNSGGNTFSIGALSGTSTATLGGAHYAGALTYSIGALNKNTTYGGTITNSTSSTDSASGSNTVLTKVGTGTLTWNGGGSHTGATTISGGTFILNGTFGRTPTTIATGAKLGGSGRIGDSVGTTAVTAASGSTLMPGAPGLDGQLQLAALTLNGATLQYDLSSTPGVNDSLNDRITLQRTLTISGTQNFQFNLTNGSLGGGIYPLIDGGNNTALSSAAFTHNLPATTRQSFAITSSANGATTPFVQLAVTGNSQNLTWTGAAGNSWNLNSTASWALTGGPATFYNLDAVTFDNTTANGSVTLIGTLQPQSVTVANSTTAYTFSGSGSIGGSAALTKSGGGSLTINTANSYTRGTTISGGTVSISTATGLGSGFVALNSSTLNLTTSALAFANELRNTGTSVFGTAGGNNTLTGNLVGSGTLNFNMPAGGLLTLQGNIDAFAGTLGLTGSGGSLRFNPPNGGGAWGGVDIAFDAGAQTILNRATTGVSIDLGSLTGVPGSQLRGSDQAGPATDTYVIGALNSDTTFGGAISNGSNATPHTTAITKVGTGTLTLSGTSSYSGDTAVTAGTLAVSGSLTSVRNLGVSSGAALRLAGGTVAMDQVVIDTGGSLLGCGTLVADLINNGTVHSDCGVKLTINGDVINHGTFRITRGTDFELNGNFTNTGLLDLLTADVTPEILATIVNEGVILDSSKVQVAGFSMTNGFTVTIQGFTGHNYRLQRSSTLAAPTWSDVGPAQPGNGSVHTFSDPSAPGEAAFYRVAVEP
jgi:autotransporter-associated beta strand protein